SIKELVGTITKIRDELEREVYLKTLANKIDISFGTLQKEAENLLGRTKRPPRERSFISEQAPETGPNQTGEISHTQTEVMSVAERTFLKALLESTYHGPTVIDFVVSHQEILTFRHPWVTRIIQFVIERYQHVCAGEDAYSFDFPNELAYIEDEELRNFISELLIDAPVSPRWPSESPSNYARRCVTAFLDATSKMVLSRYQEARAETMRALDKESRIEKQEELIANLNQLRKQELQAKQVFEGAIKNLLG
ncbi:MAG: hypothetical protein HGB19_12650, partial [Chlorobiales bacterium]|nr:hypothetical protein [Chlorobiales bacterium]